MALEQQDPEDDAAPGGGEPTDRATRFIARLDTYLPKLADDGARQAFLDRQLAGWEHRYSRFIATEGASEPIGNPTNPPQVADFLLTITALAARRNALGERASPPLDSAVLSLLVAADQRCPAIIGQAHLLYYARLGTRPETIAREDGRLRPDVLDGLGRLRPDVAKTLTQLKRDAEDLCRAIADVEAAMKEAKHA
jgi:hypothetical protein